MRTLQIANDYLGSKLYSLLFSALEERGHSHQIFVPVKNKVKPQDLGENIHVVPCFDDLDRLLFFRKQNKMLSYLEGKFHMDSFDLVHAHTVFSAGYTALQLKKRYDLPYIVAVRDTDVNIFYKYMIHLRPLGVEILKNASHVIFLSPAYRDKVLSKWVSGKTREEIAAKSHVIPNGIAKLFLEPQAQAHPGCHDPLRLICVGLINSRKNPELTVEAAQLLRNRGEQVNLTFIGQMKEEKYKPLMEKDFVTWVDKCPQTEVLKYLHQADIFVMPSHTETFGLVYAEAMSQGLPVLYTAGQGFDGQFPEGEVGFAVSDEDAADIADKVLKIRDNYVKMSENAVSGAARFDWDAIGDKYHQLYQEMHP